MSDAKTAEQTPIEQTPQPIPEVVQKQYDHLVETIRAYNPGADFAQIDAAFHYAAAHHGAQKRKDGSPFVTHPIAVAQIVAEELHLDSESIIAALLHDCIEDTDATYDDIAKRFSPTVADLVEGVSKLTRVHYTSKEEEQMENLRKMLMAMAKDIRVILIKIADRTHNMRTMEYQSTDKQRQKSLETMEIYAPIAHRLGMQRMKWELEDLSLKYLDPTAFNEITHSLEEKSKEYGSFMERIQKQIEGKLTEDHIPFRRVYGRMKHPYSIYRKMYAQSRTMDEVFDLFAFRVIVDTVADCYNVLGVIHDLYRPVLGRFKDYIGTPKPNGYQSLHTTVMGPDGVMFEVQIRTQEMHDIAEYGIAAHWKYKQGISGSANEQNYEWVRRLLENQENTDAEEFIHTLKVDMFADEVFVFTPRGDVTNLPTGATPIDFAYSVHSAVGNSMVGAKVNGRIVPLDYQLKNGDVVEILTSKSAHGPSRDWLQIAKSNEARGKIRQWFKKEKREENIVNGRAAFESELKHYGISVAAVTGDELRPTLLKKTGFGNLDDMYAAIGYGGITCTRAVNRFKDEIARAARAQAQSQKSELDRINEAVERRSAQPAKAVQGVLVEGMDNCLIKFSRCCTPVPGDPIIGFITRGQGVSIHRADCPNYLNSLCKREQEGRWLNVSWADKTLGLYSTTLRILARDRNGLILDIAAVLNALNAKVRSLNARSLPEGNALVYVTTEVPDLASLRLIIARIRTLGGVREIDRGNG